jgi:hypothetical protein
MTDDAVILHRLDDLQRTFEEMRADIKEIKDAAPIHRIQNLEQWRRSLTAWLAAVSVTVVGALVAALLR